MKIEMDLEDLQNTKEALLQAQASARWDLAGSVSTSSTSGAKMYQSIVDVTQELIRAIDHAELVRRASSDSNKVVAVLATSKPTGDVYAKVLGLTNYRVVTSMAEIQGLQVLTFVITPGYYREIRRAQYALEESYDRLVQETLMSNSEVPPAMG